MNTADQVRLRAVCAESIEIDLEELEAETDFYQDLNLSRDDLAEMLMAVEEHFGIELDAGIADVRTFADLEALVEDEIPA